MTPHCTSTGYNTLWDSWNSGTAPATSLAWGCWTDSGTTAYIPQQQCWLQLTKNEIHAQQVAELERARIEQIAETERVRIKQEAEVNALKLLRDTLTPRQLEAFEKDHCIPIDSEKGNRYLIRKGRAQNIEVIDKGGNITHRLCAHPVESVPDYDTMLAQKLFLEHNEEEFLRVAHRC